MRVRDLISTLRGFNQDMEVALEIPTLARPGIPAPYLYRIQRVYYSPASGVSGDEITIEADKGYDL